MACENLTPFPSITTLRYEKVGKGGDDVKHREFCDTLSIPPFVCVCQISRHIHNVLGYIQVSLAMPKIHLMSSTAMMNAAEQPFV